MVCALLCFCVNNLVPLFIHILWLSCGLGLNCRTWALAFDQKYFNIEPHDRQDLGLLGLMFWIGYNPERVRKHILFTEGP